MFCEMYFILNLVPIAMVQHQQRSFLVLMLVINITSVIKVSLSLCFSCPASICLCDRVMQGCFIILEPFDREEVECYVRPGATRLSLPPPLVLDKAPVPLFYGANCDDVNAIGVFANWRQDWEYTVCSNCQIVSM